MTGIDFNAALAQVVAASPTLPAERIATRAALGRVLADDVPAQADYPRFDCSAMDGYAIVAADTAEAAAESPLRLVVEGESRAGAAPSTARAAACAISTGAPLPVGFDAVIPKECAGREGSAIVIVKPVVSGWNVRRRAEDIASSDVAAERGRMLTPQMIGALCGFGVRDVPAVRLPRMMLLPTGDELRASGPGNDFFVHDANGPMIAAMARQAGISCDLRDIAGDSRDVLALALDGISTREYDIVVSTGGISAGDHDHLPTVLADIGATVHFHGVDMRPGRPLLFATLPDGTLYFGLPGNPIAAAVAFRFFVIAAIRKMSGRPRERGVAVQLDLETPRSATTIFKASRRPDSGGRTVVDLASDQRSHTMRQFAICNTWVVAPPGEAGITGCRLFAMDPSIADLGG